MVRRTLDEDEIRTQVLALENKGHKRLILVFGDHPQYDAEFMAECVQHVYGTASRHGEIRRVSINAAPLDHQGYAIINAAKIATYQIFQETYHHETYRRVHPPNTRKADYLWRLDGVARAIEAECDDVGIGALFGLYDWRFEVLGLVSHALYLQKHYNVGPHTISFPRLRPASGVKLGDKYLVSDENFKRLVAILRLSVPYTGMVLTAREPPEVRREVMALGVSQIDAGSRVELGGYTELGDTQVIEREQFELGDIRPLDVVLRELLIDGYIPSFCTACYRLGRTGEQFMEFSIPGFIQNLCTPNALTTLLGISDRLRHARNPGTWPGHDRARNCQTSREPAQTPTPRPPRPHPPQRRAGFALLNNRETASGDFAISIFIFVISPLLFARAIHPRYRPIRPPNR